MKKISLYLVLGGAVAGLWLQIWGYPEYKTSTGRLHESAGVLYSEANAYQNLTSILEERGYTYGIHPTERINRSQFQYIWKERLARLMALDPPTGGRRGWAVLKMSRTEIDQATHRDSLWITLRLISTTVTVWLLSALIIFLIIRPGAIIKGTRSKIREKQPS